jgi:hypothetical protein
LATNDPGALFTAQPLISVVGQDIPGERYEDIN